MNEERNETPNPDTNPDIVTGYSSEHDGNAVSGHSRNETPTEQLVNVGMSEAQANDSVAYLRTALAAMTKERDELSAENERLRAELEQRDEIERTLIQTWRKRADAYDGEITAKSNHGAVGITLRVAKADAYRDAARELLAARRNPQTEEGRG